MSETASSEPRLAEEETQLATNPVGTEASTEEKPATYTDMASNAATTAATSATAAAAGVKDSVFSMFGGGEKKETKVEDNDAANDRSGSSKAQKEREDDEVGHNCSSSRMALAQILDVVGAILTMTSTTGGQGRRRRGRRPIRARRTSHSDRRNQNQRGGRGAGIQDASQALQIRPRKQRVERARHRRRAVTQAQGEWQD